MTHKLTLLAHMYVLTISSYRRGVYNSIVLGSRYEDLKRIENMKLLVWLYGKMTQCSVCSHEMNDSHISV